MTAARHILALGITETTATARRPGWLRIILRLRNFGPWGWLWRTTWQK